MYVLNWKPKVGNLAARKDIQGLIKALRSRDASIRYQAASALGDLRDQRAVTPLIETLKDDHLAVRYAAADSLGRIGSKECLPSIIRMTREVQWTMRKKAVSLLGEIGDDTVVPILSRMLNDEREEVRKAAVDSLQNIGGSAAVEALVSALRDKRIEYNAAMGLSKLGASAKEAVPALAEIASSGNSRIRDIAIWALKNMGEDAAEAAPVLKKLVLDFEEDWDIQYIAIMALKNIDGQNIIPANWCPFSDLADLSLEERIIELVKRAKHVTRARRGITVEGTPANYWYQLCCIQLMIIGDWLYAIGGTELLEETHKRVCEEGRFRGRFLNNVWRRETGQSGSEADNATSRSSAGRN